MDERKGKMKPIGFILKGTKDSGDVFYYTGRSGNAWASADSTSAFMYLSLREAISKGMRLYQRGLRFDVIPVFTKGQNETNSTVR